MASVPDWQTNWHKFFKSHFRIWKHRRFLWMAVKKILHLLVWIAWKPMKLLNIQRTCHFWIVLNKILLSYSVSTYTRNTIKYNNSSIWPRNPVSQVKYTISRVIYLPQIISRFISLPKYIQYCYVKCVLEIIYFLMLDILVYFAESSKKDPNTF